MYNTKVVCTYNTSEVFLESDNITDDEKGFIRDAIYRQELLDILGMSDYNEKELDSSLHELFKELKDQPFLKECMAKLAGHFMSVDEEFGLMILFSFDYLHSTHICISEYLETGKISFKNEFKLRSLVF
jgi:hypothetical protein